jgi:hypothetical protein
MGERKARRYSRAAVLSTDFGSGLNGLPGNPLNPFSKSADSALFHHPSLGDGAAWISALTARINSGKMRVNIVV